MALPVTSRLLALLALPALAQNLETFDRREDVAPGVSYRERRFYKGADGPFTLQWLEIDPRHPAVNLFPARALDQSAGRETVSSMARRLGAVAAVNGGYFQTTGPWAGASAGAYQWNGRVLAGWSGRTALFLCAESGDVERLDFAPVRFTARAGGRGLDGLDRPRKDGELVLYSSGRAPGGPSSVEAQLEPSGRVQALHLASGGAPVPEDGYVLSTSGDPAQWLLENAAPGKQIALDLRLLTSPDACTAPDIVGGGPRLVRAGQGEVTPEGFAHQSARHPRTAVAVTRSGAILLLTLDGRQKISLGMTTEELAAELVSLGALEAMNLDGGGSTTMFVRDRVRNSPSDGKERPVSDALLIFSVPDRPALAALVRRLTPSYLPEPLSRDLHALAESGDLQAFERRLESAQWIPQRLLAEAARGLARLEHP